MANKYVSLVGSDGNNGLGPDASHATNKPWGTLEYAVDTMASGDVLWVAPGIYRDCITIGVTPSSETIIRGDPLNSQGFKNSSGVLVAQEPVIITNLLSGDASTTNSVVVDLNGKSYLTLEKLWMESQAGSTSYPLQMGSGSHNTVRDCHVFAAIPAAIYITAPAGTNVDVLIERCVIYGGATSGIVVAGTKHTTDYDMGVTIRNCSFFVPQGNSVNVTTTGTNTNFGGGVIVQNCVSIAKESLMRTSTAVTAALTYPCLCKNCVQFGQYGVYSSVDDTIVEDYNFLVAVTPRYTVDSGANTIAYGGNSFARAVRLDFGQMALFGFAAGPFMAPVRTSKCLGYGNDSTPTALSTDLMGKKKPSGGESTSLAVGALEYHEYGTKDTATYDAADSALKLVGPGDHDLELAVDATSTTISIKVRVDNSGGASDYGGTDYPQVILLDAEALGVSGGTETETGSASCEGAWETLTFTAFTPSRKGGVVLRCVNRSNTGAGVCWFDTIAVT